MKRYNIIGNNEKIVFKNKLNKIDIWFLKVENSNSILIHQIYTTSFRGKYLYRHDYK
jgi:hypothetical protein